MNEPKKVKFLDIIFMSCQIYNKSRLKLSFKGINIKKKRGKKLLNYHFYWQFSIKVEKKSLVKNL